MDKITIATIILLGTLLVGSIMSSAFLNTILVSSGTLFIIQKNQFKEIDV